MSTLTSRANTSRRGSPSARLRYSRSVYVQYPAVVATAVVGVQALVAGLLDLTKGADAAIVLLAAGVLLTAAGVVGIRTTPRPAAVTASGVFTQFVWGWTVAVLWGALVYLITGTVDRVDDAAFEAVTGLTTTNASTLIPEAQDRGILAFRALNQWVGGAAALVLATVFIPALSASRKFAAAVGSLRARLVPDLFTGLKNLAKLYGGASALIIVAFLVAGMGPFDALTYGLTTVSTGGFANHADSIAHFNSAAIEWVTVGGMLLGGMSVLVLWAVLRGDVSAARRSRELHAYLAAFALTTTFLAGWRWDEVSGMRAIRQAAFTVASAMSTTGHLVTGLEVWPEGAEVVLLALLSVGGMAGAVGGGFRWLRVIETWGFGRRELQRQTHPNAVLVVKSGTQAIPERALGRMHAYFALFVVAVFLGAWFITLTDSDLTVGQAIASAISAMATAGPVPAGEGIALDPGQLHPGSRLALMVLMILGRLSILPVLMAVGSVSSQLYAGARSRLPKRQVRT